MHEVSTATLWNTDEAFAAARRIASLHGVYCGPAAVAWTAAVWNSAQGIPYDFISRVKRKDLFPDGPRAFMHAIPGFQIDLDGILRRETQGALRLSSVRVFAYSKIHSMIAEEGMPFIVRIPTASIRNGLHYVTLFKSIRSGDTFRFYWQDNGVFRSDEHIQEGISVSIRNADGAGLFPWGARQVVIV